MLFFAAMSRSHAADRSVADWVLWAQNEGSTDIVEKPPHAEAKPGNLAVLWCVVCLLVNFRQSVLHSLCNSFNTISMCFEATLLRIQVIVFFQI